MLYVNNRVSLKIKCQKLKVLLAKGKSFFSQGPGCILLYNFGVRRWVTGSPWKRKKSAGASLSGGRDEEKRRKTGWGAALTPRCHCYPATLTLNALSELGGARGVMFLDCGKVAYSRCLLSWWNVVSTMVQELAGKRSESEWILDWAFITGRTPTEWGNEIGCWGKFSSYHWGLGIIQLSQ